MKTRTPGREKIQKRVGQCVGGGGLKKHGATEYNAGQGKAVPDQQSQTTTDGQAASATRESMRGLAMAEWAAAVAATVSLVGVGGSTCNATGD